MILENLCEHAMERKHWLGKDSYYKCKLSGNDCYKQNQPDNCWDYKENTTKWTKWKFKKGQWINIEKELKTLLTYVKEQKTNKKTNIRG